MAVRPRAPTAIALAGACLLVVAGCGRHGFTPADAASVDASSAPGVDAALDAAALDAASTDATTMAPDTRVTVDAFSTPDAAAVDAFVPSDSGLDLICGGRLGAANPFTIPPACAAIFSASAYCGALVGSSVVYIDLDTGATCAGPSIRDADLFSNSSLGWAGDAMYACNGSRAIRISLRDGSVLDLGTPCEAITTDDGTSLLVLATLGSGNVTVYADEGDAMSARVDRTLAVSAAASRIGARGDRAVLSWHSTDHVVLADLSVTPPTTLDLPLGGYDDWVHGVDLLPSGEVVVAEIDRTTGGAGSEVLVLHDPVTGAVRRTVRPTLTGMIEGIACFSGPPPGPLSAGTYTHETGPPPSGTCGAITGYATTMDNRHPPSPPTGARCAMGMGTASSYVGYCDLLSPSDASELHVLSVYQGTSGVIDVTVHARPRPVTLALTSYEPIDWRISLDAGATLERVLVSDFPGGAASTVTGLPSGLSAETMTACGYGYGWEPAYNTGGGDLRSTIAAIRGLTGLAETTFQGCYEGTSFEVPY